MSDALRRLAATIAERRAALAAGAAPGRSHTARLLAAGLPRMARKLGEEAVETVVAALAEDREALLAEAGDTIYHLLVLLAARDLTLDDLLAELERREGRSGVDEKEGRG